MGYNSRDKYSSGY
jgi:hypothetical protein